MPHIICWMKPRPLRAFAFMEVRPTQNTTVSPFRSFRLSFPLVPPVSYASPSTPFFGYAVLFPPSLVFPLPSLLLHAHMHIHYTRAAPWVANMLNDPHALPLHNKYFYRPDADLAKVG